MTIQAYISGGKVVEFVYANSGACRGVFHDNAVAILSVIDGNDSQMWQATYAAVQQFAELPSNAVKYPETWCVWFRCQQVSVV
jgi:hypothetical protein